MTSPPRSALTDFLHARLDEDEARVAERRRRLWPESKRTTRAEREVEAKRRIVGWHADAGGYCNVCNNGDEAEAWPCATLEFVALPYADHPDYREEWKP